ncbi:MAG: hypothetical protein JW819_11910 [Candidatus Krumholzibacteriota bacterium]|nr:hypothetical protein [Candidatus Krumholzibacteriota bacterium]
MAVVQGPGRRNHIRSIRHHFLSGSRLSVDPDRAPRPLSFHEVLVSGTAGSPWILPLALNLALVASEEGEAVLAVLPDACLPLAARLLGAGPCDLGVVLDGGEAPACLEPRPGLTLLPRSRTAAWSPRQGLRWRIEAAPPAGRRGLWLYLQDPVREEACRDPRALADDPLFLVGLDRPPPPQRRIMGIWGRLTRGQLVDPARPHWPAPGCDAATRRLFRGYLEALRRVPQGALAARAASPPP